MANQTPTIKLAKIPELIAKHRGNLSAIARAMKVTRSTLHNHVNADETLKQLLADERERMLDNAEDKLGQAVGKGEAWAVCFTLKTQGSKRGYIEKQRHEHTGEDGGPIQQQFVVEIVTNDGNGSTTSQDKD